MAKKREKVDRIFSVPITARMKADLERVAELDERKPAAVARRILRDGIEAEMARREPKPAKPARRRAPMGEAELLDVTGE